MSILRCDAQNLRLGLSAVRKTASFKSSNGAEKGHTQPPLIITEDPAAALAKLLKLPLRQNAGSEFHMKKLRSPSQTVQRHEMLSVGCQSSRVRRASTRRLLGISRRQVKTRLWIITAAVSAGISGRSAKTVVEPSITSRRCRTQKR